MNKKVVTMQVVTWNVGYVIGSLLARTDLSWQPRVALMAITFCVSYFGYWAFMTCKAHVIVKWEK